MPDPSAFDEYEKTGNIFSEAEHSASERLVRESFFGAKADAEESRKTDAQRRLDAYQDDFATALKARIGKTYKKPNAEALIQVLDVTNNPLKRIVNEVSALYSSPPVRKLADNASTTIWRDVLKRAGAPVVMPRMNRLTNLLNTMLVYVRPCGDSLTLRLILPQDATVWPDPDDPTMPLAVRFKTCDPAAPNATPEYHTWDRRPGSAGHRVHDAAGKQIGGQLPNPYVDSNGRQIIPIFAVHREWPTWSFWDQTSGNDVYELTLMVGMWETWINYLLKTDSARQKYANGQLDTTVEQTGGPEDILTLRSPDGQPVTVGEFSSQSDWNGIGGQIKRKLENVLNNIGLVLPDTRTSGDPTSGFALLIRSQGLRKIQAAQIPSYERTEETMYRVVSTVHNFERTNTKFQMGHWPALPPLDKASPTVAFAPIEAASTVEERKVEQEMDEKDIQLGLASPISVYMRRHPEATEEEAGAALDKIAEQNTGDEPASLPPTTPPPQPPGAPALDAPPQQSEDAPKSDDEGDAAPE